MKKIVLIISVLLGVIALSAQVNAQEISWEIKRHSTDLDAFKKEVTDYANQGYVPLGISYDNTELYILYVMDSSLGMTAWQLDWYEDAEELQKRITSRMNNGYVPTGIAYAGDVFYVLYIKAKNSATAWRLEPSDADLDSVQAAIQPYIDNGYVPCDITEHEGQYWTLLLLINNTQIKSWRLQTYKVGTHADYINKNIEEGYIPWGMSYNSKEGLIDILYVGF
ncbi:hypothetical protein U14_05057 [Candidatus Moduliflexus flocculans]|uniref:Uncharacterized protein n=1 Tax=Candidatus Moduliflexus flocculans TaxID=1499966 RepID=A0A081BQV2_9BACT|nr:hypothetical protein U14_05057 [Candidatus Moduliflexus flocculans]